MPATVTITAELRKSTERAYGLFSGETAEVMDERTGLIETRDHYHWIAKKHGRIEREWTGRCGEKMVEIALPEWLAKKEGLT